MRRSAASLLLLAIAPLAALLAILAPAAAQVGGGAPIAYLYCYSGTVPTAPSSWAPCSATNPLVVSATITPSGTQNVNLTQILSAAPSLTNPLWVFPATGATFPVSGTVAVTQSTSPWVVSLTSTTITGNTVVVGPTADGSPASTPPVLVGGTSDGTATGTVDVWKVDAGGNGFVTDSTGAATQAPVAPATATATKSELVGCQATSAAINPTTGQQASVDCDLNNNLLVSSGGAPNLATSQASVTTGNISVASARALRRAITIANVTGTSAVFCGNTGVTTSTGTYLGASAGSSITLNTTAAVFCTVASITQTVTVAETY